MTSPLSRLAKLVEEVAKTDCDCRVCQRQNEKFLALAPELLACSQALERIANGDTGEGAGKIARVALAALFAAVDREVGE